MCVVNKQFELLEFVFDSVYVDLQYVNVMRVLLFVLHVCLLRECEGVRMTAMLVWGIEEVWLWLVQGMSIWVVHVVQLL